MMLSEKKRCHAMEGVHAYSPSPPTPMPQVCSWLPSTVGPAPTLLPGLTLNWRRRLAISYSRCSSMPRWRHHLREFLPRSDFT